MLDKVRVTELPSADDRSYDLFIATIGYELRSRYLPEHLNSQAEQRIAIGFTSDNILNYAMNTEWFSAAGYAIHHVTDDHFDRIFEKITRDAVEGRKQGPLRIAIDFSSQTRLRIALMLKRLDALGSVCHIQADFLYALADYSDPPSIPLPNTHVGPVLPSFSGWWIEPERPLAAVVGLGYEENKALGAVEHVQASSIWTFQPRSSIGAYTPALERANSTLLSLVPEANRFVYDVMSILETFVSLESFVFGITRTYNLIVLPFGPKPFALCSLLVGLVHPSVAVWRVSGGEERIDRKASGDTSGVRVEFGYPASVTEES